MSNQREMLEKIFDIYSPQYAEYLMENVTTEAVICNGATLLQAQENEILYEEFINSML
jgi:hypothetical protein